MKVNNKKAFTLVELMIVIAIIGVLAASLFPMMSGYMDRARDTATQANIRKLYMHLSMYKNDVGGFPGTDRNTIYCIPLNDDDLSGCGGRPMLPGIEALNIKKKDFTIQKEGYSYPYLVFLADSTDSNYPSFNKILQGIPGPYYILHWTMPGNSGWTGGEIRQPDTIEKANKRCAPGKVHWIDVFPNQTACQLLIQ